MQQTLLGPAAIKNVSSKSYSFFFSAKFINAFDVIFIKYLTSRPFKKQLMMLWTNGPTSISTCTSCTGFSFRYLKSRRGWGGGGGGCGELPFYGIVRMCVPNGPLFQRCQVYDYPPFSNKMHMTDPIFLDSYVKGPTFLISRYMCVSVVQRFFRGYLFSWCSMNWLLYLSNYQH